METCLGLWAVYPFLRFLNFKFFSPNSLPISWNQGHASQTQSKNQGSCHASSSLPRFPQPPSKHLQVICLSLGSDYSQILTDCCLPLDSRCSSSILRPTLRTVHPFVCFTLFLSWLLFLPFSLFYYFFSLTGVQCASLGSIPSSGQWEFLIEQCPCSCPCSNPWSGARWHVPAQLLGFDLIESGREWSQDRWTDICWGRVA